MEQTNENVTAVCGRYPVLHRSVMHRSAAAFPACISPAADHTPDGPDSPGCRKQKFSRNGISRKPRVIQHHIFIRREPVPAFQGISALFSLLRLRIAEPVPDTVFILAIDSTPLHIVKQLLIKRFTGLSLQPDPGQLLHMLRKCRQSQSRKLLLQIVCVHFPTEFSRNT